LLLSMSMISMASLARLLPPRGLRWWIFYERNSRRVELFEKSNQIAE
jgi:hypothetical protein